MKVITDLEHLGYQLRLDGEKILFEILTPHDDPELVKNLFREIYIHKFEAIAFLRSRNQSIVISDLDRMANEAYNTGDYETWVKLLEEKGFKQEKAYAKNAYDMQRCPNCPHLGKEALYVENGYEILCDTPCPKLTDDQSPPLGENDDK